MHLRQALLLSSEDAASLLTMTIPGYRLHVTSETREYTPVIQMTPGPFYTTDYHLSITRDDSQYKAEAAHFESKFSTIDALEEFLTTWCITVEDMWKPDEPEVNEESSEKQP